MRISHDGLLFDLKTLEVEEIREKAEAIVTLGMANSRMKDYYDLWLIAGSFGFDGSVLTGAFKATFERRGTDLPGDDPIGLTRQFAEAPDNVKRWCAFLDTNGLEDAPKELQTTVDAIREFALPPLQAAGTQRSFGTNWSPGTGWR